MRATATWLAVAALFFTVLPLTGPALAAGPAVVESRVNSGSDDGEEDLTGSVNTSSSDLELTFDGSDQIIGMRFTGIAIPPGSAITNAWVQFQADEATSGPTSLTIQAEASDDAGTFVSSDFDISSRPRTGASVAWSPPAWASVGEAGPDQQTPDLTTVVQEVVSRQGWSENSALVLVISGTGDRSAESYNGDPNGAPLLHVEYEPAVTVTASDDVAIEGSDPVDEGTFTIVRSGPTAESLTVSYSVGGSATPDTDYVALTGTATIPAGFSSVDIAVTPLDDDDTETTEAVTLTILDNPEYATGSPATAEVTLIDSTTPIVNLVTFDPGAVEGSDPVDEGTFTIVRSGPTAESLTVSYSVGGSATPGTDYVALTGTATIPAGFSSVDIAVTPLDDDDTETTEAVTLTISETGTYAVDGAVSDLVSIVDDDRAADVRVVADGDDAQEESDGDVKLVRTDLELGADLTDGTPTTVALRFADVPVPSGAVITKAHIQFRVDAIDTSVAGFTVVGEASDDSVVFADIPFDITSRSTTAAVTTWTPPPWTVESEEGPDQRTPDLGLILQEIVSRPAWVAGNAATFFISGTGSRQAVAHDRSPLGAPVLHIEFSVAGPPANSPPTVDVRTDATFLGQGAVLEGTVTDDSLPPPPNSTTVSWSVAAGPGTVTFDDPAAADTIARFSSPGTYTLRLTASDGELSASREVTLDVVDPSAAPSPTVRLAVFGDFGAGSAGEAAVANLVDQLAPDAILTTGDNTYDPGHIDDNVGPYFGSYVGSYAGVYGDGSPLNRFFAALGNHDHSDSGGLGVYLDYFELPGGGITTSGTSGNERYYDAVLGPVHVFVVNSDGREPDGNDAASVQAQWLQGALAASTSPWKVVTMHHPPYSSGESHGSIAEMQWPYQEWGADVVLAGHDHNYERLIVDGFPYFVTGLGGKSLNPRGQPVQGSEFFYSADYGTMLLSACETSLQFEFHSVSDGIIDSYALGETSCPPDVAIATPSDGLTIPAGTTVSFAGEATDLEDGDVTASLSWVSDVDGHLGTGTGFERSELSVGTHLITASATDSDLLTASRTVAVTVTEGSGARQSSFRFRSDSEVLSSDTGWLGPIDADVAAPAEETVRLRVEIEAIEASNETYRLQFSRDAGPWTDVPVQPSPLAPAITPAAIESTPSAWFADGEATTDLLPVASGSFVAGEGDAASNGTRRLNFSPGEQTEFEFALRIRKFFDVAGEPVENVDGTILDFRVVRSDGTPLASAELATITVESPRLLGGTYAESPANLLVADANGNLYFPVEDWEVTGRIMMMKSSDGGVTWSAQDVTERPAAIDMESAATVFDPAAGVIHLIHDRGGHVLRHRFHTSDHSSSPDTWAQTDETVATYAEPLSEADQWVSAALRSTGDLVVAFNGPPASGGDRDAHLVIQSAGSWGAPFPIDTTSSEDSVFAWLEPDADDRIHIVYMASADGIVANTDDGTLTYKALSALNDLTSDTGRTILHTGLNTGSSARNPIAGLEHVNVGGSSSATVLFRAFPESDLRSVRVLDFGIPEPPKVASDVMVGSGQGGSRSVEAHLQHRPGTSELHLVYVEDSTFDLWHTSASADGSWSSPDMELLDGIDGAWVRGSIFSHAANNGGADVFGFVYDDGTGAVGGGQGPIRYSELTLDSIVNDSPVLASIGDQIVDEGATLSFTASASDPDLPAQSLTFSLADGATGSVPGGATITPSGVFSWTPTEAQGPGVHTFEVVVTDDGVPNLTASETITVTVNEVNVAPTADAGLDQIVAVGSPASLDGTASSDPDLPAQTLTYGWTIDSSPTGSVADLTDPATATPSITPDLPGDYVISLVVADGVTTSTGDTVTITATDANEPPVLASIGEQVVDEGATLSFTASASDPDLPAQSLTFSLADGATGSVPGGATITPGGVFSWTPTEAQGPGVHTFEVVVTDDGVPNLTASETITVTVNEVNVAPVLSPLPAQTGNELTLISFTAQATDSDLPAQTLTFSLSGAPSGAQINPSSGLLSWTPTEAQGPGVYTFDVVVTDDGDPAMSGTEQVIITVDEVNQLPVAVDDTAVTPVNTTLTVAAPGVLSNDTDLDGHTLTVTLFDGTSTQGGTVIVDSDGSLIYTPPTATFSGTDTFTYVANDGFDDSNVATVTISVGEVSLPQVAVSESLRYGTVVEGDYVSTHQVGGTAEVLEEERTKGSPTARTSRLEHTWTFDVARGDTITLAVTAFRTASSDNDGFEFAYSADGGATWTTVITGVSTSMSTVSGLLDPDTNGTVLVRVVDTNRDGGAAILDRLTIDALVITTTNPLPPLPEVTIAATDPNAGEGGDPGQFTFTRDLTDTAITVDIAISGTAINGTDYQTIPTTVVFGTGIGSVTVDILPTEDSDNEGDELVAVTLVNGDGYNVGTANTAIVTITDNDTNTGEFRVTSESTSFGTVTSGDYTATYFDDGIIETLTEELYAGRNKTRLEHTWTITGISGTTATLTIDATNPDPTGEAFTFTYSLDGGASWNPIPAQEFAVNGATTLLIRVNDTNSNKGDTTRDTIHIDHILLTTS